MMRWIKCAAVLITVLFLSACMGHAKPEYEKTLFDTSCVHTVDVRIAETDWQDLIIHPEEKTKYEADLVIDGEEIEQVSFSAKGNQPEDYAEAEQKENKILLVFERTGQVLATTSLLVFPALNPLIKRLPEGVFFKWNLMYLVIAFILMILYEGYWIRYFCSQHTMKDMYAPFGGYPLAGAVLPVLALLLMGMYSRNRIVILSSIILGIGHIGIHYMHWKELNT